MRLREFESWEDGKPGRGLAGRGCVVKGVETEARSKE